MSQKEDGPRPGNQGPDEATGEDAVTDSLRRRLVVAVELLADQAERERVAFELGWSGGFTGGFQAGHDVGYERAHAEIAMDWAHMAAAVRGYSRTPSHAELELRRWGGRRQDFGKPRPGDFPGESVRGAA
jgi:hypothetical protein